MKGLMQGFVAIWLAMAAVAHGAEVAAVVDDDEPEMELDEILVHGKRLQQRIIEAEDEFYKLYNQINKDDDYDTNCAMLNLSADTGSRLNSRLCMPVFVANAVADYTVWRRQCIPPLDGFDEFSCLDRNRDERLSRQEASVRPSLDAQFMMLDADHNGYLSRDELPEEGMGGVPGYMPPPPELVLAEGTEKWFQHTMNVIRSDPRLQEMAGKLDELHAEMNAMRRRVVEIEQERVANAPPVKRPKVRKPR
jgi:hypothetical protein